MLGFLICFTATAAGGQTIDLAGEWAFRIDPQNVGLKQNWAAAPMGDHLRLPGSLQAQGFGEVPSVETKWIGSQNDKSWYTEPRYAPYRQAGNVKLTFWLTPERHYVGAAWYRRDVDVPASMAGRRLVIFLERCHWRTTLFVDGREIGSRDSLVTPHEYDGTAALPPGRHTLALRVDNSILVPIGTDSHSVTDHTETDWNGVVGKLELRAGPRAWLDDVQVYPDPVRRVAKVTAVVTGKIVAGKVTVTIGKSSAEAAVDPAHLNVSVEVLLDADAKLWDEFTPNLLTADVTLSAGSDVDTRHITFGLRSFAKDGTQFTINGRKTFIRGTLECCVFPLTGYPATDVEHWRKTLQTCKAYGLNSLRFHSWCPPEAAFVAGDELGFYFQIEGPTWCPDVNNAEFGKFETAECDRILKAYGNHPSFCMMTYGNEPYGKDQPGFFTPLVGHWIATDPRHLYCSSSGWPQLPVNQFQETPDPRIQKWGEGLASRVNALPPATTADYVHGFVDKYPVPVVTHEMGQWCAYPDFTEIPKYTGFLKAGNFEIFRDDLAKHHMADESASFVRSSGELQTLLYKEDCEAAMRTPGFGGYQLLGLQDFPGQGTALVGVLNAFWESKGYCPPERFHKFCSETVPLAVMPKRVFGTDEPFTATVRIAHFGPGPLAAARSEWTLTDETGAAVAAGKFAVADIPVGNDAVLGSVSVPLSAVTKASRLVFTVAIDGTPYANDWNIWVYPPVAATVPGNVTITSDLSAATAALAAGRRVLLEIPGNRAAADPVRGPIGMGFSSIFWNTAWTNGQPPVTLGILCDPHHPALAGFPTDDHTDWQWWYLIHGTRPLLLENLPADFRPVVQVIDDWVTNRRLGLVAEATVGPGRLVVTTIDLEADAKANPVAARLRASLLAYMAGDGFTPKSSLSPEQVGALVKPPSAWQAMGTTITADSEQAGCPASSLLNDENQQIWHTAWDPSPVGYPHWITLHFDRPGPIAGLRTLPRQDGNRHGRIAGYEISTSTDGKTWSAPIASGELADNADWQTIRFDKPVTVAYLRFTALGACDRQPFASMQRMEPVAGR
jgi:hypothetical protein